jgi:hypothetical protein
MKIFINDNELDFSLENEKVCGEILNQLQVEFEKDNGTIFKIIIDDVEITAEEIENYSQKSIDEVNTINIIAVYAEDIKISLKELALEIESLNQSFEELPVYLQGNNQSKVPEILTKFADNFSILCRLISLTALFPEYFENIKIDDKNLSDFIRDFSPFLEDFENAIKDNDTVTIGDIAEYEIKPRFESFCEVIKEM